MHCTLQMFSGAPPPPPPPLRKSVEAKVRTQQEICRIHRRFWVIRAYPCVDVL